MHNNDKFSFDNFKKWMESHPQDYTVERPEQANELVGAHVKSKVQLKKLMNHMEAESGDLEVVANEFMEHGGTITNSEDRSVLIETKSGSFSISKCYIKKISS